MQSEIKLVLIFNFRIYLRIKYTQNDTPEKNRQKRVMLYKALTAMIRKNNLVLHEKEIHSGTAQTIRYARKKKKPIFLVSV